MNNPDQHRYRIPASEVSGYEYLFIGADEKRLREIEIPLEEFGPFRIELAFLETEYHEVGGT